MNKITKTIVVTGANKGIGFGIVDDLLKNKNLAYKIVLCSRNIDNGNKAK